MSASSISMAATTIASSSICCKKPSTLSFPSSLTLTPTHLPSKPRPTKPLNLKTHLHNFSPFVLISLSRFPLASTAFDSFETEKDSQSTEQEDPEVESSENQAAEEEEEEEEGPNVLRSSEEGRLYVGNLLYSMTSAQLAEIFEEAGRVVSVEVVYDRITDRSRGFAFVSMGSVEEAKEAIRMFDGSVQPSCHSCSMMYTRGDNNIQTWVEQRCLVTRNNRHES